MSTCVGRNVRHCRCVLLLFVAEALDLEHTRPKVPSIRILPTMERRLDEHCHYVGKKTMKETIETLDWRKPFIDCTGVTCANTAHTKT
jgi:hypothetical protein